VLHLLSKKEVSKMAPHLLKDPGLEGLSWSLGGSEMNPRDISNKGPFGGSLGVGGGGITEEWTEKP